MWLNKLEKLKTTGQNRWRSACPVHKGSNATALSIKLCDDNSYIVHCFACGANGVDVFKELDIDLKELFGDREHVKTNTIDIYEKAYIAIAEAEKNRGARLTLDEKRKARLYKARLGSQKTE